MIAKPQPESRAVHPLARFVTLEAIALLLNLQPEEIYEIRCWRYVIHVVGKGISRFVSYGDMPPILDVEPPTTEDMNCWRKRWQKTKNKAPEFWVKFFAAKFRQAASLLEMYSWGRLVNAIKFGLKEAALQWLRSFYAQEKYAWQHF